MKKGVKIIVIIAIIFAILFVLLYKFAKKEARQLGLTDEQYVLYKDALSAGKSYEEAMQIAKS